MKMIEVIGCTSAGKSTLVNRVLDRARGDGTAVSRSYDFVLERYHVGWIRSRRLRMLVLNVIALGASLVAGQQYRPLLRFATGVIWRLPRSTGWIAKLKLLRIVYRNVGIDSILRHMDAPHQVVVADEGILQIAHYLFVHVAPKPKLKEVAEFLACAPLPDQVLYLRQPADVLLERVRARGHHRIPTHVPTAAEDFVYHAVTVFDYMSQSPRLAKRLTAIDGQRFDTNRATHPDDSEAMEAIQTILAEVYSGLANTPVGDTIRGRLDYRISG